MQAFTWGITFWCDHCLFQMVGSTMSSTTTATTMEKLRELLAQLGLPEVLVSNNGANLVSIKFKEFLHLIE